MPYTLSSERIAELRRCVGGIHRVVRRPTPPDAVRTSGCQCLGGTSRHLDRHPITGTASIVELREIVGGIVTFTNVEEDFHKPLLFGAQQSVIAPHAHLLLPIHFDIRPLSRKHSPGTARRLMRASRSAKATCFELGRVSSDAADIIFACVSIQVLRLRRSCCTPQGRSVWLRNANGRFRAECLNAHWFLTLADAAEKLEAWRPYYNSASLRPSFYVVEGNRFC